MFELDAEDIGFIIKAWGMCAWCGASEALGGMVLEADLLKATAGRVADNVVPSCSGCRSERGSPGWRPDKRVMNRVLDFLKRSSPVAPPPRPKVERGAKGRRAVQRAPEVPRATSFPLCAFGYWSNTPWAS